MTKCVNIFLATVAIICARGACGQLFQMAVQGNDGILEKLKPSIGQISKSIAAEVSQGQETESLLNDLITKDLRLALEKLSTLTNSTKDGSSINFCCKCNRCARFYRVCNQLCCQNGDQGCHCTSCTTGETLNVNDVGQRMTSSVMMWLQSAKNQLRADITHLLEQINAAKSKCCTCLICSKKFTACFIPFCCAKGGKICKCVTCSAGKVDQLTDSNSNAVIWTQEADTSLDQLDSLIDSLLVLVNYP